MKPAEVALLSFTEMTDWLEQQMLREEQVIKVAARVGYRSAVVSASAFAKTHPTFEDLYPEFAQIERQRAAMEQPTEETRNNIGEALKIWALQLQAQYEREGRNGK